MLAPEAQNRKQVREPISANPDPELRLYLENPGDLVSRLVMGITAAIIWCTVISRHSLNPKPCLSPSDPPCTYPRVGAIGGGEP